MTSISRFSFQSFNPNVEVERPSFELGSSAGGRAISDISRASDFRVWLCDQALIWKDYLNAPNEMASRRAEFFQSARQIISKSAMDPSERMKAIPVLKSVEELLDRGWMN